MDLKSQKNFYTYFMLIGFTILLLLSYQSTEFDFFALFGKKSRRNIFFFVKGMFPPDTGTEFLKVVGMAILETISISIMGTLFGIVIALSLTFFATRTLTYSGILHEMEPNRFVSRSIWRLINILSRLLLNLFRAVPELVWALIFILSVGIGPFPGVLALGVHTGGILGKLYSEFFEDVDSQPLEALLSMGTTKMQILLYGMLPQALPQFISYTLYRWEVNIRAATILGYVGAGGIGQQIYINMNLTFYNKLMTLILVILLMVTLVDRLSAFIRRKLLTQ